MHIVIHSGENFFFLCLVFVMLGGAKVEREVGLDVRVIFLSPFVPSSLYGCSSWRLCRKAPVILSAVQHVICILLVFDFVAESQTRQLLKV